MGATVRSVTHSRFGDRAVKSRLTRSPGRSAPGSRTVVRARRRRVTPQIPAARINAATWSRPISWPARRAASHSLRAP